MKKEVTINYEAFVETIKKLVLFLMIVEVPTIKYSGRR